MRKAVEDKKTMNGKKILIIIVAICSAIILIEGALFLYIRNQQEKKVTYYDAYQMVLPTQEGYVAVGSSDFKKSKKNPYTDGIEKGKLVAYKKDGTIQFEIQYDRGIASTFTSVLVLEDGYLVTGSGEFSDYQRENNLRDAFLIKYDQNGKKVWEKFYGVLSNTRFNKVIAVADGFVVIGQSLYENMEVGNHTTGGGIIVKYDFEGNEVWHNNHGGNKSGNFNGIVEVDGNFYVVGKDAKDSGNLIKFDQNGKYVWHKNYSYTDSTGFQDVVYSNQRLYVVGSKKILEDENDEERATSNTDAIIVSYDMKGNIKKEVSFGGTKNERFTAVQFFQDHLYVIGVSNSLDSDLKIELQESEESITSGIMMKYSMDLELVQSEVLGGMNNDVLTELSLEDNRLYIAGYSNSKNSNISTNKNNGKDYFGKLLSVDENLRIEVIQ